MLLQERTKMCRAALYAAYRPLIAQVQKDTGPLAFGDDDLDIPDGYYVPTIHLYFSDDLTVA